MAIVNSVVCHCEGYVVGDKDSIAWKANENMDQNFLLRLIKCSSIDVVKFILSYHSQENGPNFPSHCFYFAVASMTFSSLFSVTEER